MNNVNYKKIILNSIKTPDGTVLISHRRHDYIEHLDRKTNKYYSIDGGMHYLKRGGDNDYIELSVYDDADFDIIRTSLYRYNVHTSKYTLLKDMSDSWLKNVIKYHNGLIDMFSDLKTSEHYSNIEDIEWINSFYVTELEYRKNQNIFVDETDIEKIKKHEYDTDFTHIKMFSKNK